MNDKTRALFSAIRRENLDKVKRLVEMGADIYKEENKKTPLIKAIIWGQNEIARWLMAEGPEIEVRRRKGYTLLHMAVSCGNVEMISCLLRKGAHIEARDDSRMTPLAVAASLLCPDRTAKKMLELLASHGARLDARDKRGNTLLHHAAQNGGIGVARILIKKYEAVVEVRTQVERFFSKNIHNPLIL